MEENYYDILEINKNASQEIIDKAYKTLVKKYHPDLQDNNLKLKFEEKIKKINEAYEILSNPEKRKNYDLSLKCDEVSLDDYNSLLNENVNLKKEINYLKNNYLNLQNNINNNINYKSQNNFHNDYKNTNENEINRKINNTINKAYLDAYIQDLKNSGYKIKYKKTMKDFIALFLTIIIILFIGFILWNIPFTKNYFINLYNENSVLKFIVNLIINIFR